jgi:hypothetical protein
MTNSLAKWLVIVLSLIGVLYKCINQWSRRLENYNIMFYAKKYGYSLIMSIKMQHLVKVPEGYMPN